MHLRSYQYHGEKYMNIFGLFIPFLYLIYNLIPNNLKDFKDAKIKKVSETINSNRIAMIQNKM